MFRCYAGGRFSVSETASFDYAMDAFLWGIARLAEGGDISVDLFDVTYCSWCQVPSV